MFNMPVENNGIELVIVRDSTVIKESMKVCKLSEEWLNNILKRENVTLNDIFIMTSNTSKSFNIIKKERV